MFCFVLVVLWVVRPHCTLPIRQRQICGKTTYTEGNLLARGKGKDRRTLTKSDASYQRVHCLVLVRKPPRRSWNSLSLTRYSLERCVHNQQRLG